MQIGKASRYDLARVPATTSKDASTEAAFRPLDPATSSSAESGCAMSASESEVGCGADSPLVLDYEQLERLRSVIETPVLITGRLGDRVPTLRVRPLDLVRAVRDRLHRDGVQLRDIRLNGGAASYVLGGGVRCGTMSDVGCIDADDTDDCCGDFRSRKRQPAYNDLDLIFRVHLSGPDDQEKVREAVLAVLPQFMNTSVDDGWLQTGSYSSSSSSSSACSTRSSTPTFSPLPSSSLSMIGHSYVHKMFRIYSERGDRWSLISLSNVRGRSIELKFADMMRRQFQFSVDSFQIILDGLLAFYDAVAAAAAPGSTDGGGTENSVSAADAAAIILTTTPNFYPTVQAESAYDRISVALDHLRRKLIVTRRPEEIRGGGLLKYCSLLVRGYETLPGLDVLRQERYMCSRFFIDFPRLDDQRATLENYLAEHFVNAEDRRLRFAYLSTLGRVIESSTIRGPITMGFSSERAATLLVVRQMALTVLAEERMIMQQQQQQQQHMRHKAMIMMSMNATSGGLVETTPSPPGSPVKNGEDFLPSAFESHPFMVSVR
jgi:terminal nucleotidyltransferase 5A/B